jgi:hypothetical protein
MVYAVCTAPRKDTAETWLVRGIHAYIADMGGAYADLRGASRLHPESRLALRRQRLRARHDRSDSVYETWIVLHRAPIKRT